MLRKFVARMKVRVQIVKWLLEKLEDCRFQQASFGKEKVYIRTSSMMSHGPTDSQL